MDRSRPSLTGGLHNLVIKGCRIGGRIPRAGDRKIPRHGIALGRRSAYPEAVKPEDIRRYRIERAAMQAALGTSLIEFAFDRKPRDHCSGQGSSSPCTSMFGRVPRIISTTPVPITQSPGPTG